MRNEYKNQTVHHHLHQKSIYLPMFCRSSVKDIALNNHIKPLKLPAEDEPSSPKVSCMGQVKRNNRVIGCPSTTTSSAVSHPHKLKMIFSGKNLLPPATSRSCRTNRDPMSVHNSRRSLRMEYCDRVVNGDDHQNCVKVVVNIDEMDPPLPVVKKVAPPGVGRRDEVNLWKRRFNEAAGLKSLQIEQIHLPNCKFQTPTTV